MSSKKNEEDTKKETPKRSTVSKHKEVSQAARQRLMQLREKNTNYLKSKNEKKK